jgi:transcription elongation factor Elf1
MSLVNIRATFDCDICGKRFSVELDPATSTTEMPTVFDLAVDACRGSVGYQGPDGPGFSCVDGDKHVCGDNAAHPEDDDE